MSALVSKVGLLATVLVGCASVPAPVAPPPGHPASSEGREAPFLVPRPTLGDGTTTEPAEKPKPAPATEEAAVYTCPMHPEVERPEPGHCPVCGMKLVPKKPGPGGGEKAR